MLQPIAGHSTRPLPSGHWSRRSLRPALGTLALGVVLVGCSDEGNNTSTGGTGGANTGGIHTGGTSTGGASTGGMSTGGANTGGTTTGGTSTGGVSTGGTTTGGTAATSGGASSGGTSNAGAMNGGSSGAPGGTSGAAGTPGAGGAAGGGGAGGGSGGAKMSAGCTTTPATLKSATVNQATPVNSIMVGGQSRQFLTRWPANYDNKKAYPLHIGLHGANGNISENGRDNFGLWSLSQDSVIFVTLVAMGGLWSAASDLTYADAVLKQVQSELCIDTSKIVLQGFSQGAAMSWYLTGSRPGVFRAVIGHSGGGVQGIPMLSPVAYFGSLGTGEGGGQNTQTDQFAKANGCTIDTLPRAETGKHVCTPYAGCKDGFPVTWCSYDGGHGFQDTDSGSSKSWVPEAVWAFLTPLLM
jgi:poly(3-hydroxybutyrate) depolymerase